MNKVIENFYSVRHNFMAETSNKQYYHKCIFSAVITLNRVFLERKKENLLREKKLNPEQMEISESQRKNWPYHLYFFFERKKTFQGHKS